MYPSVILTHAGINGKIGRKLPREDMMGGTNDVPLDPKTEVMLENCPDGDIMESTDDVPLDPTYRQYDDQWKVVVLPPRRYEGKCENNDAPLALEREYNTSCDWCLVHTRCVRTSVDESSIDEKIAVGSERLDRRNVGDWFRVFWRRKGGARLAAPRASLGHLSCGTRCPDTRSAASLDPGLCLA